MPVMDGWEATELIRKYEKEKHLEPCCIVALTALGRDCDIERSIQMGCNYHYTKPVKKMILQDIIGGFKKTA